MILTIEKIITNLYSSRNNFIKNDLIKTLSSEIIKYAISKQATEKEIESYRQKKNTERGSFDRRVYCYLFLLSKSDDQLLEYKSKKNQYTEIIITENNMIENYVPFVAAKLVRNKVPERLSKQNRIAFYKILNKNDYKLSLWEKLIEEFNELKNAQNINEIIEESSDVLEVLFCLEQEY